MGKEVRDRQRTIPRAIRSALLITVAVYLVAALAALGALLGLIAWVLAMARHRDLPGYLSAVHPRYRMPHHAEVALAVVVSVLVATVDLRGAIGFSSFGVLVYYAIANASAYTLVRDRRLRRWLSLLGVIGCVILVATLPWQSIVAGLVMFAVGIAGRAIVLARRRPDAGSLGSGR